MLERINKVTTPYSAAIYLAYPQNPARTAAATLHETIASGDVNAVWLAIPWVEETATCWHIDRAMDWVMILRHGLRHQPEYDLPQEYVSEVFGDANPYPVDSGCTL